MEIPILKFQESYITIKVVVVYIMGCYICPVMRNFDKFNNFFKLNMDIPETDRAINIHTHSSSEVFLFIPGFNQGLKVCRYCNTTHPAISWHRTNYELSEYVSK